ncbi:hypothetical protein [Roseovarius sp.]
MNLSRKIQSPLARVEIDEWQVDLLSCIQLADLDALSDDKILSELVSKNEETRFWIHAFIDKRTKLCLGVHTCPREITPETLLAWKGKYQ